MPCNYKPKCRHRHTCPFDDSISEDAKIHLCLFITGNDDGPDEIIIPDPPMTFEQLLNFIEK